MDKSIEMKVENLAVGRSGVPVLEGISFTLAPGQVMVLRGPNGSGKTTLLRTLAGLQLPMAGSISVPGESIAYGAHADGLKSTLSVRENLDFWAKIHAADNVDEVLERFNLTALADRPAANLSAGQKRRLGLARLLVSGRAIWLLDEPTVSLDVASVEIFAQAVRDHVAAGGAALIATHIDLRLEADLFDVTDLRADPDGATALAGAFDEAFA